MRKRIEHSGRQALDFDDTMSDALESGYIIGCTIPDMFFYPFLMASWYSFQLESFSI